MNGAELCEATYVLPIRRHDARGTEELVRYLRSLPVRQLVVVDGSTASLFDDLHARLSGAALHIPPDSDLRGKNGKVRGAVTGLRRASYEKVVVADDDVRYDRSSLDLVLEHLDRAEVVRPQNYFEPRPWHAVLDESRSLINRALDGDWPGTLAVRRSALPAGYNADVLFENLELVRTVRQRGGREVVLREAFVARRPPTVAHFLGQRVRQAYDEFARPVRLGISLAILPLLAVAVGCRAWEVCCALAVVPILLALRGWARDGAARYFSAWSVALAPVWVFERAVCAWLALYERCRYGGVRYGASIIASAASNARERARWAR